MWVDVKTISEAVGLTPRAIQIRARKEFQWRQKNGRSIEILVASLPEEWQVKLAREQKIIPSLQTIKSLVPAAQIAIHKDLPLSLGKKATEAQRQKLAITKMLRDKPPHIKKGEWVRSVAGILGISESTVYRVANDSKSYGIVGKPKEFGRNFSFDPEAIAFLQGFWLQAQKEGGFCSKTTAWTALQVKAKQKGWKIGSRSSTFKLLKDVDPLLVAYAIGGNRALDNYFFVSRDCTLLNPMQVVIGDQHIFDWWVADYETGNIFRPECYLWEDHATKLIYGIAFDKTYSSDTVKESLRLGLHRFGAFDCTYNDNGSSECSKAITSIIDDLIQLQMDAHDVSDLYRTPEGIYVIENEDGDVVDTARSEAEWRKKHRRIYANVKNAKTKDIERFFRTLEERLAARMLPGRVATPGAPADVDEVERKRLDHQKANCQLLTVEQFMLVVLEELDAYEHSFHSALGMTPVEALEQKMKKGWKPRFFDPAVVDMIMFDRVKRKVNRGQIDINRVQFIGEELRTEEGRLADVGLWSLDGQTVEVRYNKHDLSYAYAIVNGEPRPLKAVQKISNLDEEAMIDAISLKRRQMKAVREAFKQLTAPIGGLTMRNDFGPVIRKAQRIQDALPETTDVNLKEEVQKQIGQSHKPRVIPMKPLHAAPYERYNGASI